MELCSIYLNDSFVKWGQYFWKWIYCKALCSWLGFILSFFIVINPESSLVSGVKYTFASELAYVVNFEYSVKRLSCKAYYFQSAAAKFNEQHAIL